MIKRLIIGGCSFSVSEKNCWPYHLYYRLREIYPDLKTQNIAVPSQGNDRIQKKLIKVITSELETYLPHELFVCVMWSGTVRRSWYVDNPLFINQLQNLSVKSRGTTYLDQLKDLDNTYKKLEMAVINPDGQLFNVGNLGGWIHNKTAGQVPFDFLQSEICLNKTVPGESLVHRSIENIIALQNFCYSKKITLVHQFYMDHVYQDIENYKEHQIIKYLIKQLDIDSTIIKGQYDFLLEHAGLNAQLGYEKIQQTEQGQKYFVDGFHSSSLGANLWVEEMLWPLILKKITI